MPIDTKNRDLIDSTNEQLNNNKPTRLTQPNEYNRDTESKPCKNHCGEQVYLKEVEPCHWLPYNSSTHEFHKCTKKPSPMCKYCMTEIVFKDEIRSSSGKLIPLNPSDHTPHNCPKNPFNLSDNGRHYSGLRNTI
ncbi:MAG: hypothetical protein WA941_00990 [Nitrososphaeraceae archaeon]